MHRRTLWDNADFACPIVGTCLTVAELRKLCRKCGDAVPESASDYEAHGYLVGQAKLAGSATAKYLQKYLDRKFRRDLRAFFRLAEEEDLRRLWRERAEAGDIPGAFWALMSHPGVSDELMREVYGEVHMLSHRIGAANRADLTRLAALEDRAATLAAALDQAKAATRRAVAVWKGRCRQAMAELATEQQRRRGAERERISLRQAIETSAVAAVSRERDHLRQALTEAGARLESIEAEAGRQAATLEQLHGELIRARAELAQRDGEVAALEAALLAALGDAAAAHLAHAEHHLPELADLDGQDQASCQDGCARGRSCRLSPEGRAEAMAGLRGKRVLYVGGRCSLVAHYKLLAAKFGCELLHHDGGREQSAHRLWELLGSADAVVCPLDCVSHEACSLVKQACKGCLKPLVLARSSGLSSLARSLAELGATVQ
jgi:hypothetical protein